MAKPHLYVIESTPKFTCRQNCMFFDDLKGECIVYKNKDYNNPRTAASCDNFDNIYDAKYDEDREDKELTDLEVDLLELLTQSHDISNYPQEPSLDLTDKDFYWYVSPDESFGCWIKNDSLVPTLIYSADKIRPKNAIRYRSLIPLHDHVCSDNLKNTVVWYVDPSGYGQYTLYYNGSVQQLHNLHF